ncbi:fatty acid-binding protein, liver [Astyanax mexicanus]|uniref:Fatty acid-binding protein, liver-like n=1 Tax=Astyanax mexicanus TaxID=7994 RepID=A0A8T2ML57_ASTMX|nr:fatty acid-binding protein, liver [Astyanax mexicanus]KAG9281471.1 fatty acid-binding protein, liver-like [Astyanax mexicanus]
MEVDFSGKWEIYEQSDPGEFLKAIAAPDLMVKMMKEVKPVTVIKQDGEKFEVSVKTPLRTNTNSFTIGQEAEFTTMNGMKFKATPRLVDGKMIIETDKLTIVREIQGEDMVETMTAGSATLIRKSRRA